MTVTRNGLVRNGQILVPARVDSLQAPYTYAMEATALIDTGAMFTGVSPRIAKGLAFQRVGQDAITAINGQVTPVWTHMARIDLRPTWASPVGPATWGIGPVQYVLGLTLQDRDWDVLIGMDYLKGWTLALSGDRFTLGPLAPPDDPINTNLP